MKEQSCAHHATHDDAGEPTGPECGKPAVGWIYWRDGRRSPFCPVHGPSSLDADALALVARVEWPRPAPEPDEDRLCADWAEVLG